MQTWTSSNPPPSSSLTNLHGVHLRDGDSKKEKLENINMTIPLVFFCRVVFRRLASQARPSSNCTLFLPKYCLACSAISQSQVQISLCSWNSIEDKQMIQYKKSKTLCLVLQFIIWFCRNGKKCGWKGDSKRKGREGRRHLLGLSANTSGDRFMTAILAPRGSGDCPRACSQCQLLLWPVVEVRLTHPPPPPNLSNTHTRVPFIYIAFTINYKTWIGFVQYQLTKDKLYLFIVLLMAKSACKSWLNVRVQWV